MAELLIYDKEHWMDSLTQQEIDAFNAKNADFQLKYDSRYQRGDIVEVRKDDAPHTQKELNEFDIIKVPDFTTKDAMYLMEPLISNGDILKRRKHYIDLTMLSVEEKTILSSGNFINKNKADFDLIRKTKVG